VWRLFGRIPEHHPHRAFPISHKQSLQVSVSPQSVPGTVTQSLYVGNFSARERVSAEGCVNGGEAQRAEERQCYYLCRRMLHSRDGHSHDEYPPLELLVSFMFSE